MGVREVTPWVRVVAGKPDNVGLMLEESRKETQLFQVVL